MFLLLKNYQLVVITQYIQKLKKVQYQKCCLAFEPTYTFFDEWFHEIFLVLFLANFLELILTV